ncbi:hypothetical protein ACFQGT_00275 [Natrialbaceae archaeon GCM10025810]
MARRCSYCGREGCHVETCPDRLESKFGVASDYRADGEKRTDDDREIRTDGGVELPMNWPETFTDPELDCNHAFTWDTAEGEYLCMYCGESRERPPESSIEAQKERNRNREGSGR